MTALPSLTLDTSLLPPAQRLAAWRAAIPQYDADAEDGRDEKFQVLAKAWLLGDLVVTHTVVSAVTLRRTPERIRADGANTYNLNVLLRGSWTGDIDRQEVTAGPGQLVGFDLSRPFEVKSGPSEHVSLVIGRSVLQDAFRGEPDLHGRVFEGAAGLLLGDHCLAMARHLPGATAADATPIVQSTLALLVAALPAARAPAMASDAGQHRIRRDVRRFVDRHIGDADLGPDAICRSLGLSRTTLYRTFGAVGGVVAFIQRRRLQAVRALLLHPSENRTIGDISQSLGFASSSHFAAAFRKEFGCSPRDVRTTQRIPVGPPNAEGNVSNQFQAWLTRLGAR